MVYFEPLQFMDFVEEHYLRRFHEFHFPASQSTRYKKADLPPTKYNLGGVAQLEPEHHRVFPHPVENLPRAKLS